MSDANESTRAAGLSVIHVINGEHYSGAERVQDLLAQRLPESGFHVTFVCVKPGKFAALRSCRNAAVIELPMRWRVDARPAVRLAAVARRQGSVLFHAHTPRSLLVARMAAWLTNLPLVYHVHSPTSRDSTQALRNWLNNKTERLSLTGADRLITVSSSLAAHMCREGHARDRIVTVANGVPIASPPPTARPTPSGMWTLGTVALFRPRKGLEVLLESLAYLNRDQRRVRLRAIGAFESPDYQLHIHSLVTRLGIDQDVQWAGFTRDVPRELAKLDLFVLPSLFGEGLPMVVLEAMAAGVPVVATRVEGVPEAVRDGREGLLTKPGDAEDLARSIERIMDGHVDWQILRTAAIKRQGDHFSDRRMAEQVAHVYQQVLCRSQDPNDRTAENRVHQLE